jgi:hypothetical protein
MRGKRAFVGSDLRELIDLYRWGARMSDLCMLYGVERQTIRSTLKMNGVRMRAPHRLPVATPKRLDISVKSTRPTIPADVRFAESGQEPDQLLRSSARVQRDRRIAARRSDASNRSCLEEAS